MDQTGEYTALYLDGVLADYNDAFPLGRALRQLQGKAVGTVSKHYDRDGEHWAGAYPPEELPAVFREEAK